MAGYIKELFADVAREKIDVITRCDLHAALQRLYDTGQIDKNDLIVLTKYSQGYSLAELQVDYPNADERLIRTLALVEYESGYTDAGYLHRVKVVLPKYNANIRAYANLLHKHGRTFE